MSSSLRCAWSPPNYRFLTARVETSGLLSEEILWRKRSVVHFKRHKYIISNLFYKQTHCMRAGIDTKGRQINKLHDRIDTKVRQTDLDQQARHLLEIFVRTLKPL